MNLALNNLQSLICNKNQDQSNKLTRTEINKKTKEIIEKTI